MPHVTGHFCVCHVELWLLFHDFFPVPGYLFLDLDLGTWVPGYLGTWVCLSDPRVRQSDSGVRL